MTSMWKVVFRFRVEKCSEKSWETDNRLNNTWKCQVLSDNSRTTLSTSHVRTHFDIGANPPKMEMVFSVGSSEEELQQQSRRQSTIQINQIKCLHSNEILERNAQKSGMDFTASERRMEGNRREKKSTMIASFMGICFTYLPCNNNFPFYFYRLIVPLRSVVLFAVSPHILPFCSSAVGPLSRFHVLFVFRTIVFSACFFSIVAERRPHGWNKTKKKTFLPLFPLGMLYCYKVHAA